MISVCSQNSELIFQIIWFQNSFLYIFLMYGTERIRIQISGQDYYAFGVGDVAIWSSLVNTLKQISKSDQNMWYISRHPNQAHNSLALNTHSPYSCYSCKAIGCWSYWTEITVPTVPGPILSAAKMLYKELMRQMIHIILHTLINLPKEPLFLHNFIKSA